MIFEEVAELVRMTIDTVDGVVAGASLAAPQQFRIIRDFDVVMIAQACSLDPSDIEVRRHPPCLASCGAPFVIAEVRDRAALRRAQQRMDVFLSHLPRDEVTGIHGSVEASGEVTFRYMDPGLDGRGGANAIQADRLQGAAIHRRGDPVGHYVGI